MPAGPAFRLNAVRYAPPDGALHYGHVLNPDDGTMVTLNDRQHTDSTE
jgi:hypothetical protein